MKTTAMNYGKYYWITVAGIEIKAMYINGGWFQTIEDKWHISQITSFREA